MIQIINKSECCGCLACIQICPNKCITKITDEQGFAYPQVDASQCINCKLCDRVCPVLNQSSERLPINVYAAKNTNNIIRKQSSSGGIFTSLATKIINQGGVVFGARFSNSWSVVHDYIDSIDQISLFRGSKYVQSDIGDSYKKALFFLKQNRLVLFTGTPCQIRGLKNFLRKDFSNLLCVDVVCHGVPSPFVWSEYLKSVCGSSLNSIDNINFRNKDFGWNKYSLKISFSDKLNNENNDLFFQDFACNNEYLQGFIKNLYLRPSCFNCPAKSGKSYSDITIADYWGINQVIPDFSDEFGVSLVLIYSAKGNEVFKSLDLSFKETTYKDALHSNPSIVTSASYNKYSQKFWKTFNKKGISAIPLTIAKMRPNFMIRSAVKFKHFLQKIFV